MDIAQISTTEAHDVLCADPDAVYLDVRTEREFEQGHPPGALNVPVVFLEPGGAPPRPNDAFVEIVRRHVSPDRRVLVGCQSGMRSQRAAEMLAREGYPSIANVRGGFGGLRDRAGNVVAAGWRDSNLPVETGAPAGRSYRELAAPETSGT